MDKPTVYIETTIAGHLTSRLPKDPIVAGQMLASRRWWIDNRLRYDCYTSVRVLEEAGTRRSRGRRRTASSFGRLAHHQHF